MDKHVWGWKRRIQKKREGVGLCWQGVHLQLAYRGILIRPAKTRHLPLKCHILVRAGETATGFVDFCQPKGAAVCLLFHWQFLFCSVYPEHFLLTFSCSFSWPFCYAVYSVMNGSISSWAFFPPFSWNRLQSVQLCGNKIDLAKKHWEGGNRGRKTDCNCTSV